MNIKFKKYNIVIFILLKKISNLCSAKNKRNLKKWSDCCKIFFYFLLHLKSFLNVIFKNHFILKNKNINFFIQFFVLKKQIIELEININSKSLKIISQIYFIF